MRRVPVAVWTAAASLVAVLGLGVVMALAVRDTVQDQAVEQAARSGEMLAHTLLHTLGADALGDEVLSDAERSQLDALAQDSPGMRSVRLWGGDGFVVYDSDGRLEGTVQEVGPLLRNAYAGRLGAHLEHEGDAEAPDGEKTLLEVYAPLQHGEVGAPLGVLEVYLDYDDTEARAQQSVTFLATLLGIGFAVLWAVLWGLSLPVRRSLRRRAQEQEQLALTDPLTGLPNRRALVAMVEAEVSQGRPVALLLLDLDRFKEVNDTLGHHVGDQLLVQVGMRLRSVVDGDGTVARLGGDEFAVVLPGVGQAHEALLAAARVEAAFDEPFPLDHLQLDVEPSTGVALAPLHAAEGAELLQRADVAMYTAKSRHGGIAVYDPEFDVHSPDRLALLADLRVGLAEGELSVVYQPCYDLTGEGRCLGVEALVRWHSPKRGFVPPGDFVPLCERTGLVRVLTRYVLDEALGRLRSWDEDGLRLNLAVNLSASNLAEDDLPEVVGELLERHGVAPDRLVLEVTESAVISDPEGARTVLRGLVELGVDVAIDDFGMGWSSMSRLLQLPLAALKVDRSFVADLPAGPGAAVVQATTGLGHDLGLYVVAEGIETAEQLARVVEIGCDVGQGYLLSRPLPPERVPAVARLSWREAVAQPVH